MIELARRDGIIAEIGAQLQQYQALLRENTHLPRVLENPGIDIQVKTGIMTTIFERTQPAPLLRNCLLLLMHKGRLPQLDAETAHRLAERLRGGGGGGFGDSEQLQLFVSLLLGLLERMIRAAATGEYQLCHASRRCRISRSPIPVMRTSLPGAAVVARLNRWRDNRFACARKACQSVRC